MDTTTISNRELLIKNITEIATAKPTEIPTNHVQNVREQTVIILPATTTTTTTLPTTTTSLPTTTTSVPTTTTTFIPTTVRTTTIPTTIPPATTQVIIPIVDTTTTTLKTTQFDIPEDPPTTKSTNSGTTNAFDRNIGLWQELLRFQPAIMHSTTEVIPIFTREIVTSTTTIPSTTTTSKPIQRFEDINVLVSIKYFSC